MNWDELQDLYLRWQQIANEAQRIADIIEARRIEAAEREFATRAYLAD